METGLEFACLLFAVLAGGSDLVLVLLVCVQCGEEGLQVVLPELLHTAPSNENRKSSTAD